MFQWIVVVGGVFAFTTSMGIGSNDAANAFATSVGSGALTLRQAAMLAVVFETSGALLMGSHVTDTIRKSISDYTCFEDTPELLMYGCMWVLVSVTGWLFFASYNEMPVSTTHSCIGGMIGMTLALSRSGCVIWYKETDSFPYVGGVSGIVLSWFLSPLFAAAIASCFFTVVKHAVLKAPFESERILIAYPGLVFVTLMINSFFIIYKGAKGLSLDEINVGTALGYSTGISTLGAIASVPVIRRVRRKIISESLPEDMEELDVDIYSEESLGHVEAYDKRTEETFKYLQIFAAVCDSFSHGANDVANAIGPFATLYIMSKGHDSVGKKLDMGNDAYWMLAMGGAGISVGLVMYGKKIIHAIGTKLTKITPSRGTCVELSSAIVVIIGSRLKIPLSTTHCQVGATVGVGLLDKKNINYYMLTKVFVGWVTTCVVVGFTSYVLTLQGVMSPMKTSGYSCVNSTIEYNI